MQLLSKDPIYIPKVGGVISPTLSDIVAIGESMYEYYLTILIMNEKTFFAKTGALSIYEGLDDDKKSELDIYTLLTSSAESVNLLKDIFNFFIKEDVEYDEQENLFFVKGLVMVKEQDEMQERYATIGIISKENYREVANVILKRNNVTLDELDDIKNVKNKKALSIMQKLKNGREKMKKANKADENMELDNIISAVASEHKSLNLLNIWDLTVYQLWNTFARLVNNNVYHINTTSMSIWGDKDKSFKIEDWYKKLKS